MSLHVHSVQSEWGEALPGVLHLATLGSYPRLKLPCCHVVLRVEGGTRPVDCDSGSPELADLAK